MRLRATVAALSLFAAREAAAQCTTCSPLSLPSGSLVGQDLEAARRSQWSVVAQGTTGWVGFPHQVADNARIATRESARFDLFSASVQASALHRSGLGIDAVMPFGILASRVGSERRQDSSLGDLELKPRATTVVARTLRLTASGGAAFPTGSYTERSGPGALGDAARALTIGRGVFWGIAEVEGRLEPVRRIALTASAAGRVPLDDAPDGFRWGPELRTSGEFEARPIERLGLAIGSELSLRGAGSIVDPFLAERVRSSNVRATILSLTPSARLRFESGVFASVTGRVPIYQDLEGLQFRQGPGLFASIGYVFSVGDGVRNATREVASNQTRFVVREYGADWCEACKKLEPLFGATRARRMDVRFEHIDVTDWSEGELARRVPGAHALPVVEIVRDGSVIARLEGDGAFQFEHHLEAP
jgi:hypothetical protein